VWIFFLATIGYLLYFLWEIVSAFGRLTPFRKLTKILRRAFLWIPRTVARRFGAPKWAEGAVDLVTKFCPFVSSSVFFALRAKSHFFLF